MLQAWNILIDLFVNWFILLKGICAYSPHDSCKHCEILIVLPKLLSLLWCFTKHQNEIRCLKTAFAYQPFHKTHFLSVPLLNQYIAVHEISVLQWQGCYYLCFYSVIQLTQSKLCCRHLKFVFNCYTVVEHTWHGIVFPFHGQCLLGHVCFDGLAGRRGYSST